MKAPKPAELPGVTLKCQCSHKDHMVIIERDDEFDEFILYMQMDHWLPWYKRLALAWRYIRGKKAYHCHFAETVVNGDHFRASVANITGSVNKHKQ